MNVSIVGSGYVGTTVAACLADLGHDVVNVEIDEDIVETINAGEAPIHESGLEQRIADNAGTSLRATTDYASVRDTEVTILCLPTPQSEDGSLDLAPMRAGTEMLGEALADKGGDHLVVVKSTVLPGTTEDVVAPILEETAGMHLDEGLEVAMNPEFLRMGTAVGDFLEPDKVVVGTRTDEAAATLRGLYAPILGNDGTHLVETDVREAELIKYANNAFLAAKVSLVNELGNVAKEYGADAYEVLAAVGLDDRISERFMRSGLGWGGSCFPKDVAALRAGAREQGYDPDLLDAVVAVNDEQPRRLVALLADHVDLEGARIAVLGLSFKPGTDDIRKSRALDVLEHLESRGATVVAYDPVAMDNVREKYPDLDLEFADSAEAALEGADGAVVATDWPEFDDLAFDGMRRAVLVDGRRVDIDEDDLEVYEGLTW
ncbi:UDP-glucose 6-dehydrogenase AglM [Natronobacterium gregoryi]|uniref:UDP-glucose 6-dehydrogenase n=2 Tax=Natronobacterium gregoryi TaxID=44930 RepID=L0AHW9_NATGS|nr:UDP-glucose 6-dehydrogenase AglM [Natronobacterium gregoryi]AFZ73406.1 nucleotide sugar dehydrogenase [Natronobacterium gregoryi SP2]ELY68602.1 nucleotide sugar dehydrogenase [Natronobacterium gregoryi SP2]PLK19683.1 UDP-glucose/GDP-mannose dehydrogenase family protein [Natronobacterium gregoryi SP2]SFI72841.1 UDPglucose 6-dehydrogenase [Natronobacterium gregoryi]